MYCAYFEGNAPVTSLLRLHSWYCRHSAADFQAKSQAQAKPSADSVC